MAPHASIVNELNTKENMDKFDNYAINEEEETIVIITAYEPDPELWDETYSYKVEK